MGTVIRVMDWTSHAAVEQPNILRSGITLWLAALAAIATGLTLIIGACTSSGTPVIDASAPAALATQPQFVPVDLVAAAGGDSTHSDAGQRAFFTPSPGLSDNQRDAFNRGAVLFNRAWVAAPDQSSERNGLGPLFNAQSCAACHIAGGRGVPPHPTSQLIPLGLLLRLSQGSATNPQTGGPVGDPVYGLQLQDRAAIAMPVEGQLSVSYETIAGSYGDGSKWLLESPTYGIAGPGFGPLADEVAISPRFAQQLVGLGLLEAIPAEAIIAASDPDDADGDGISGRPNMVWDSRTQTAMLGRFGWKANVSTVEQQVADAFHDDLGVTSTLHPLENCPRGVDACLNAPTGGSNPGAPDLSDAQLSDITTFNRALAVPATRNIDNPVVIAGASLFSDFGCAACHTPTQQTGASDIADLANQTIHPYTDLLLHDMGEGLADNRPDYLASGSEWRTPPLWGLGLIDDVNRERFLLHDGRAASIEEAILWHGGEAFAARESFRLADAETRSILVAFLEAL